MGKTGGINDLKQPAHLWLADLCDGFSLEMRSGNDNPQLRIKAKGIVMTIALVGISLDDDAQSEAGQ